MNEYEYIVLGRDWKKAYQIKLLRQRAFDTREEALRFAYELSPSVHAQVVAVVRHPASDWLHGPYPSCRTPALCRNAGYCKRDPACDN